MAALVAGLALGVGDRTSWLAAILADRSGRPGRVIIAAALAFGLGNAVAAQASLMMPLMTPNASRLLLAMAFGFAAAGALWGARRPASFARCLTALTCACSTRRRHRARRHPRARFNFFGLSNRSAQS